MSKHFSLRAIALPLLAAVALVSACSAPPPPFNATEVPGLKYGYGVELTDTDDKPRRIEDFRGNVTVVFFGFTRCPDVCPTTLMRLRQMRASLGAAATDVKVVLISVDPERDTADALRAYVKHFDPSFIGLRSDPKNLEGMLRAFHSVAVRVPAADGSDYTIDHSSSIFVYDRKAELRLLAEPNMDMTLLAADLRRLVAEGK